jgi:hypothetical protein
VYTAAPDKGCLSNIAHIAKFILCVEKPCLTLPSTQAVIDSLPATGRRVLCYYPYMIYFINFLAVAAIPLAIGGYGAHLAAKILESQDRRKALTVIWILAAVGVLLSGVQQILIHRSDRAQELQRVALQEKADRDQQQLREKLDSSLRHEEDVKQELGSILQFLHTPQPGMDSRHLADATSTMVENAMHR